MQNEQSWWGWTTWPKCSITWFLFIESKKKTAVPKVIQNLCFSVVLVLVPCIKWKSGCTFNYSIYLLFYRLMSYMRKTVMPNTACISSVWFVLIMLKLIFWLTIVGKYCGHKSRHCGFIMLFGTVILRNTTLKTMYMDDERVVIIVSIICGWL